LKLWFVVVQGVVQGEGEVDAAFSHIALGNLLIIIKNEKFNVP